ncbi:YegP family protein [Mycobacterium sp.]|uniref:YegP family protein n=1 Tax=Mycobacterium sp. TaxID=1785 RepID=UPI002C6FE984|nr:YegP family protein [Mycobacterium sp.]HME50567.1 YegP family protein [Mycobacterium sp.]
MAGKFEVFKDHAGKFRFHLKAGNGEIIASSQAYETKASAKHGVESVKENAPNAKVEDLTETHDEGVKPAPKGAP